MRSALLLAPATRESGYAATINAIASLVARRVFDECLAGYGPEALELSSTYFTNLDTDLFLPRGGAHGEALSHAYGKPQLEVNHDLQVALDRKVSSMDHHWAEAKAGDYDFDAA